MFSVVGIFVVCVGLVAADFPCVCNYNVEKSVLDAANSNGTPLGYMYEFDCKPQSGEPDIGNYISIMFESKIGYVLKDPQVETQTCPGTIDPADLVTTTPKPTTTTTTPKPTTTTTTTTPKPTTTTTTTTPKPTTTTTTPKPTTTTTTTTPKPTTTTTTATLKPTTTTTTTTPKPTTTTTTTTPKPTTTTTTTTTPRPTTTTTTTTTPKPATSGNETIDCAHNKADIVFLLDSSYSEGADNFKKQLEFVANFTKAYDIGRDKVQVGVVTFATSPHNAFHLNQYTDKTSLLNAIGHVAYSPGSTSTDEALKFARTDSFSPSHGARFGVPKVLVVMTDGQSTSPTETAKEAIILQYSNIKVIAIGIGSNVMASELNTIATDAQHMFTVPSFDSLQSIEKEIQNAACITEIIDPTTCENKQADIVFVLDSSGSEGHTNFQKQLDFVSNVTDTFDIGPNNIQVSLVTFSTHSFNEFFLNAYPDKDALRRAIENATYQGGTTNTAEALNFVRDNSFKPENGGRGGAVTKLVVVLTDGRSNSAYYTQKAALNLQHTGVKVISVGIGHGVSVTELSHIATDPQHVFSVADFDSLSSIRRDMETAACTTPSMCGDKPTDIVFVLDSSSSEQAANFKKQLDFMTNFVKQFDIGPSDVQIGLVTFSSYAHNEFYLKTYTDKPSLLAAIQTTRYRGGTTATYDGLRYARYQFGTTHGGRANASRVTIVLTDGKSSRVSNTISEAQLLKHLPDMEVIAIGIGNDINQYELNSIATDRNHAYSVGSFDILHTVQEEIKDESCGAGKPKPTPDPSCGNQPADIVFVLDSSASEGSSNFQKQVDFVRDFVYQFAIGPQDVQVSVVVFSSGAHEQFALNKYHDQASVLAAIAKITYNSGATYTDRALKYVRENSFTALKGARANATHLVVVITDGQSTHPTQTKAEASLLKNETNMQVIAIGIGTGVLHTELQTIASDPAHAIAVANFDALQTIKDELTFVACKTCNFVSKADIVFVLDASSSEGAVNFHTQLDFVSRVVNDFRIGPTNVQIGVVTFSDYPNPEFYLNQYSDKSALLSAIQQIAYLQGLTNTDQALQFTREKMFAASAGARTDAKHYVVILTDGTSADTAATINQANMLKQQGIDIIAIGIGTSINKIEIEGVASDPNHVFTVSDFSLLKTVQADIKKAACEEVITTTTTPKPTTTTTTTTTPKPTTTTTTTTTPAPTTPIVTTQTTEESENYVEVTTPPTTATTEQTEVSVWVSVTQAKPIVTVSSVVQ